MNNVNSSCSSSIALQNIKDKEKGKNADDYSESSNKLNNNILDFSAEMPRKGHFRNLSNVETSYPKFRDSFISGSYLTNLNDFHIAESSSPKKERTLNFSFLPRKNNQSQMDDFSPILGKKYEDKVTIAAPSWPLFYEK